MEICTRRLYLVKILSSDNDEMTYQVLVLIENERRSSPVELDSAADSVNMLANSWHDDEEVGEEDRQWEEVFGECAVKQWGLPADFAIPYMACSAEKPDGKDE